MIFFTGDTHFGDPRILRIDRRPFPDLPAHDAALIEAWNAVVGSEDEVWHLGDVAKVSAETLDGLLARLKGRKHLVVGNNDDAATVGSPRWASVQHYAELVVDETHLILCHYAFRTWNKMGKGSINLHGHSHGRLKPLPRQYDVGVDAFPFRPVRLPEILASRKSARTKAAAPASGKGDAAAPEVSRTSR